MELVDTLDSGSSARKGVGVRLPPFAPFLVLVTLLWFVACSKQSRSEQLFDRHNQIVEGAMEILRNNAGDQDKAQAALRAYVAKHRPEIRGIIRAGHQEKQTMSEAKKAELEARARDVREPREHKISEILSTYPNPKVLRDILRGVMQ